MSYWHDGGKTGIVKLAFWLSVNLWKLRPPLYPVVVDGTFKTAPTMAPDSEEPDMPTFSQPVRPAGTKVSKRGVVRGKLLFSELKN